jgi:tetratricopeptide (TPR) repeat protein
MKLFISCLFICILFISSGFADLNLANISAQVNYSKIRNMDYTNFRNNNTYRVDYNIIGTKIDKDITDYINLGFIVGSIESTIIMPDYKIISKENIFLGLDFINTVRLSNDLTLSYNIGYLNTLKKDIENTTTKIKDLHINKFWTEVFLTKEFESASVKVGVGYLDSNIRSDISSTPSDLFYRFNNDIKYYMNSELNFEINPKFDFYIGYSFLAYSNVYFGIVYHFAEKESAEYKSTLNRYDVPARYPDEEKIATPEETRRRLEPTPPQKVTFPEKTTTKTTEPSKVETPTSNTFQEYRNEGMRFFNAGNYNEALKNFEFALKLRPNSIEVHKLIGDTYEKMGKYSKALEYYDKAIILIEQQ